MHPNKLEGMSHHLEGMSHVGGRRRRRTGLLSMLPSLRQTATRRGRRCSSGYRKNKGTSKCVRKTHLRRRRCPNGYRKLGKTKKCHSLRKRKSRRRRTRR